jgi:hypothetical protein
MTFTFKSHFHINFVQSKMFITKAADGTRKPAKSNLLSRDRILSLPTITDTCDTPQAINPLTPELNPSAQRCLTRFLLGI